MMILIDIEKRDRMRRRRRHLEFVSTLLVAASLLVISTDFQTSNCLDSPVKIKRQQIQLTNRTQQQQSYNEASTGELFGNNSSDTRENIDNIQATRIERRVRARTEEGRQQSGSSLHSCPSNRLIQTLLSQELQHQAGGKAQCECTQNSSPPGWHITCFSGSAHSEESHEGFDEESRLRSSVGGLNGSQSSSGNGRHRAHKTQAIALPSSRLISESQDEGESLANSTTGEFSHKDQAHLTFQTIPVLFSIKYVRNNMIEIDCDQASPNYKPAMLQGKFISPSIQCDAM